MAIRPDSRVGRGACALALVLTFASCGQSEVDRIIAEANASLAAAEEALADVGYDVAFGEEEKLSALETELPDPDVLAAPAAEVNFEIATSAYYNVFDLYSIQMDPLELNALERPGPAAPAQFTEATLSERDQALLHLQLAYIYLMDAFARLSQVRDGAVAVDFGSSAGGGRIYELRLAAEEQGLTPDSVLASLTLEQRQAVLDAMTLVTGGVFRALTQGADVDTEVFRRSALFHVIQARKRYDALPPRIQQAMDRASSHIQERVASEGLLAKAAARGFTIEQLPPELAAQFSASN